MGLKAALPIMDSPQKRIPRSILKQDSALENDAPVLLYLFNYIIKYKGKIYTGQIRGLDKKQFICCEAAQEMEKQLYNPFYARILLERKQGKKYGDGLGSDQMA